MSSQTIFDPTKTAVLTLDIQCGILEFLPGTAAAVAVAAVGYQHPEQRHELFQRPAIDKLSNPLLPDRRAITVLFAHPPMVR